MAERRKDKNRRVLKEGESQRKDGTYDYRWRTADGKRHSIYAKTLDKLREKEEAILQDKRDGIRTDAGNVTLNDIFDMWVELKKGLKDNTFQNYQYMYRQFVCSNIGYLKIMKIKRSDIRRFYNTLFDERGLKISTIDNIHTVLHQVLEMAVEDNYLRNNPSDNALKELKKSRNFDNINTPKTKAGKRVIPMTEEVKEAFLEEKSYQEMIGISCKVKIDGYTNFIFINRYGNVQHQGTLNKALRRIMRDCNQEVIEKEGKKKELVLLPKFSCHILRHTFATRLCESGVNIKVIQDVLGHADISTTMNIYADATKELKERELKVFEKYLKQKEGEEEK